MTLDRLCDRFIGDRRQAGVGACILAEHDAHHLLCAIDFRHFVKRNERDVRLEVFFCDGHVLPVGFFVFFCIRVNVAVNGDNMFRDFLNVHRY